MENFKYIKEIKNAAQRFRRGIDFRAESALSREVSNTIRTQMNRTRQIFTENLPGINTLVNAKDLKREISRNITEFVAFYYTKIASDTAGTTNEELMEEMTPKLNELIELLGILESDRDYFSLYVRINEKDNPYIESELPMLRMGFDKIVLKEKVKEQEDNQSDVGEEEEKFNLFFNEMGRAYNLNFSLQELIEIEGENVEDYRDQTAVFGSNKDPSQGEASVLPDGFLSLRGGPRRVSSGFAGISFENRASVEIFPKARSLNQVAKDDDPVKDIMRFHRTTCKNGYEVVLLYHFDIANQRSRNRMMQIESAALLDADRGLVSVIYKNYANSSKVNNQGMISRILHEPNTLPRKHSNRDDGAYVFEIEKQEKPLNFFGRVVTMEDVAEEFDDIEDSFDELLEMGERSREDLVSDMSIQEIKEGHIPTLSTTGIPNGRYVDEVMRKTIGIERGFDHIVATKIIKRTITDEVEEENSQGDKVTKHIEKNANIILSKTLTPEGEFITQFNNDENPEKEE